MATFRDDFDGSGLDRDVWLPHYLPHWSSLADSAATYAVADSELRLTIPREQQLWCPDTHATPLRVSGVQSGHTSGQQAFREGLEIREDPPDHRGWTVQHGRIEIRARMELSPRSMASVWFVGLEDVPGRSGEICVFEIFGDAVEPGRAAAVGMGIKQIGDPVLRQDFAAPRLDIDVAEHHTYAAEWRPGRVELSVDGQLVRVVEQAPDYPLQAMVAVFDFPEQPGPADHVPLLAVDSVAEE